MKLSRPVAIGLMALLALIVLWLVIQTMNAGDETPGTATPTSTGAAAPTFATPGGGSDDDTVGDQDQGRSGADQDQGRSGDGGDGNGSGDDQGREGPEADANPGGAAYPEGDDAGPTGTDTRDWDGIDACYDDVLPPELEDVADDIEVGGPFDYPGKDGSTFGNREGFLPDESGGYYREYTVETPGLDHRGARRIVTGGGETDPEVWYYTDDHYASFCEFAPSDGGRSH